MARASGALELATPGSNLARLAGLIGARDDAVLQS